MTFEDIIGQSFLKTHLTQSINSGRIPHAQLYVGKRGVGALPMAIAYADYLMKQQQEGVGTMNPLTHPNIHFVYPVTTSDKVKSKPHLIQLPYRMAQLYRNKSIWIHKRLV